MNLFVDGIDIVGDSVFGRADAGTSVNVWVHGDGRLTTTVDGSGNWTADFSGMTDLTYLSDGGSEQVDADGDATGVWWASPKFQAHPDYDWVASITRWRPGATISLTIEDGSGVVHSDYQTADTDGNFFFELGGVFDLQRGHVVTVSDGAATKTHTVIDLYADTVDPTADTVSGRAPANTTVHAWIHGEGVGTTAGADGSGNWTADFSGLYDLTYLTEGGAEQSDEDGDSTAVEWFSPRFGLNPDDDWVSSQTRWTPGSTISLTIEDGSGVVYTDSQTADTHGNFHFELGGVFDLQRGHMVTVADGTTTKTHTVRNLFITNVDVDADVVHGTAASGSEVEVYVHEAGTEAQLIVPADGTGSWAADFSSSVDLRPTSDVHAAQSDEDGDSTMVPWRVPVFRVAPDSDSLWGWGWSPNTPLTISIDGGSDPYSTTVVTEPWGDFWVELSDFDIEPGDDVTITDGITTKAHTVLDVTAAPDHAQDTVSGTAAPFARIWVNAHAFENDAAWRRVEADGSGAWIADFSVPWEDQPAFDLTEATFIDVEAWDEDGDATARTFGPPTQANRGVAVTPIDNHVWVANSGVGTVTRLDNDGNILEVIDVGDQPTGVAVDAAGKVWVTNLGSDDAMRIDPNAGPDGLGAVDLTVELGPGASPYNYSDMTGAVVVGSTSPQGFWTVIQDSGRARHAVAARRLEHRRRGLRAGGDKDHCRGSDRRQ